MANQHLNTLELITLQNQLLLSIGANLNARECIHKFIQAAYKALGLKSIHLYVIEDTAAEEKQLANYLSLPDNKFGEQHRSTIDKMLQQFENSKITSHLTETLDDNEILAFPFGSTGILLMENRQGKIQDSLKDALVPVINKSSEYFQLCVQQKKLNKEARISKDAQRQTLSN